MIDTNKNKKNNKKYKYPFKFQFLSYIKLHSAKSLTFNIFVRSNAPL